MKKICCELCDSFNVVKENELYVCKECGASYTLEKAKTLLVEVKEDTSEMDNLFILARRALANDDYVFAAKCYSDILLKNPNNWEATFYQVYCSGKECKISEIGSKNIKLRNAAESAMNLAILNLTSETEIISALNEIVVKTGNGATISFEAVRNWYNNCFYRVRGKFTQDLIDLGYPCIQLLYSVSDKASQYIQKNNNLKKDIVDCWKRGVEYHIKLVSFLSDEETHVKMIFKYIEKIKKYDPYYVTGNKKYDSCNGYTSSQTEKLNRLIKYAKQASFLPVGILFSIAGLLKTQDQPTLAAERKIFVTTMIMNIISTILLSIIFIIIMS